MLKATTGFSINSDSKSAGAEAARRVRRGLNNIKIVFAYFSNSHDLTALLAGLKSELPDVPIIGGSTCQGLIIPDGFIGGKHFLGLMAMEDEGLTVGVGAVKYEKEASAPFCESDDFVIGSLRFDDNPLGTARDASLMAMRQAGRRDPPSFFYMTSPPSMEEHYLKGIAAVIGRRPFSGSTAGDCALGTNWALLTQEGPLFEGLALAFFYTDKTPLTHYSHPYTETNGYALVTKMIGYRRLAGLNGRPPLEVIAETYKCSIDFLRGGDLSLASPLTPFGVKTRSGDLTTICHPVYGNSDGSIFVGSPLFEGTAVIRMKCSVKDIVLGCGRELKVLKKKMPGPAGAFHMAINYTWKIASEDRFEDLVRHIQDAAGDVPFICAISNGEHGFQNDNGNMCGGPMMSYTGFFE
jgi:hypothetical protein